MQRSIILLSTTWVWLILSGTAGEAAPAPADIRAVEKNFAAPPASARPWVYWFWKNGNISREGITADLEAMHRVGIGGVILMEVALVTPPGPVPFFSPQWRELFRHAAAEADRLGIEICVNSAPGWTGSGGPWVPAEHSMQKIVASRIDVTGPRRLENALPQPETLCGFYRDVAVLAYPKPAGESRIPDIAEKALYKRGPYSSVPGVRAAFESPAEYPKLPPSEQVPLKSIVDLTQRMDGSGRLNWEVPAGTWTVVRFGTTSTGQTNRPAPSPGLECDKLDTAALDTHFRQFTAQLLSDAGVHAKKALVATHMDSWEVGGQNWTGRMREEFRARRGYDLLPYLPVMIGQVVESLEVSERFLWDLRQTVSEMIVENHGRRMRQLANEHGMWLSIEPYDMTPCNDMSLGATADVPMCEFWINTFDTRYSVKEATSIGHVYGKPVIAAEAFTSTDSWVFCPADLKPLGDWAFCEGVNRFVIHRYIHQPFLTIQPGLSLGPHGVHYERTETWWELTRPWHQYLARCQYLLRQGLFVADVLYLSPEGAPNVFQSPKPALLGYKFDACTPEALLSRVSVRDGTLVLPDGNRYQLLVLPESETMTPKLLGKVAELVRDGATVVGLPPRKSPSLSGLPECDRQVQRLADEVWGSQQAPDSLVERPVGKGKVVWGGPVRRTPPTTQGARRVLEAQWIWGGEGNPTQSAPPGRRYFRRFLEVPRDARIDSAELVITADNYFVAWINGSKVGSGENFGQFYTIDVSSMVRPGRNMVAMLGENSSSEPNPAGIVAKLVVRFQDGKKLVLNSDRQWQTTDEVGSDWVRDPKPDPRWVPAKELGRVGIPPWGVPALQEHREVYPPSDVIAGLLRRMGVSADVQCDKPLRYCHRTLGDLDVYFLSNGTAAAVETSCTFRVAGKLAQLWDAETGKIRPLPQTTATNASHTTIPLRFEPSESFFVVFRGNNVRVEDASQARNFVSTKPAATIGGPWTVEFQPALGGPKHPVEFSELVDWTRRPEDGIKYYSGTATYRKTLEIPASLLERGSRTWLDLGRVAVMARVKLNGKELGVAWKTPYRVDIREAARPGENRLEIEVVNLWPNRMIGDERLPLDCDLRPNRTLQRWPQWLLEGKHSPTGRYTFATWREWTKDSPLLESGLLGPVTVQVEQAGSTK